MALLTVLELPDSRLKKKSEPVTKITPEIQEILNNMTETLYHEDGVGLAAPQVNIHKRIIVVNVDYTKDQAGTLYKIINPEIIWRSDEMAKSPESCLSVPAGYGYVMRHKRIRIKYLDEKGDEQVLEGEDLLAFCLQHEIDHLDGILYIEHLSSLKKEMILKKLEKFRRKP